MTRIRRTAGLLSSIAALSLILAACTLSGEDSAGDMATDGGDALAVTTTMAADTDRGADSEAPSPGDAGGAADGDADLGDDGIVPVLQPTSLGRDIIYTADITVAVTDVAAAGDEATRVIQGLGGYLFGQRTTGAPDPTTVLTFKVAPEDFQTALDRLGSIGEIRSQVVTADDVTERIVDLESRITTAAASVERLRGFLENATTVQQVAELEGELLRRETELETLRGRLRTLQDQVALATIVVTITEAASRPALDVGATAYPGHDGDGLSCPGDPGLQVETDAPVTVCFEILNTGDTSLRDFELRDPVLDLETDDLILVFGEPSDTIEPGESIVLAAEITPERTLRTRTTVSATAVDEDGTVVSERDVASTTTIVVSTVDPGGIPTFTDGLEASWDLLVDAGRVAILVLGWLVPFLWIPPVVWLVWRYRPRRPTPATPET